MPLTKLFPIKNKFLLPLRTYHFIAVLFLLPFHSFAQIGINTTLPTTTLDINGALSLRESPRSLILRNGNNGVIGFDGETIFSQYRIEGPTAAFSIEGIKPVDMADGKIVRLINTTNHTLTIVDNSPGGVSRILCPAETNLVLVGKNSSVTFQYSKGLNKWTVLGYASKADKSINRITAVGTTDIARQNSSWASFDEMNITFTPENPIIYIAFNAFGSISGVTGGNALFRILKDNVFVPNSEVSANTSGRTYNSSLSMFPIKVTPGVAITIKVQWYRSGQSWHIIENNPASNPDHGRYLTILDID